MRLIHQRGIRNVAGVFWLAATVALNVHIWGDDGVQADSLSRADRELLARVMREGVTDPTGKEYVRIECVVHTCWGQSGSTTLEGWQDKASKKVFLLDGDSLVINGKIESVDFVAECRDIISPEHSTTQPVASRSHDNLDINSSPASAPIPLLIRAAWAHRLGYDGLAAELVLCARKQPKGADNVPNVPNTQEDLRAWLAWRAFSAAANAFIVTADAEALAQGERLKRLYPEYLDVFGDGRALLADLERRQANGTSGRAAAEQPRNLKEWPSGLRVSWLIEQLDQVNARQWGQPGGVPLGDDWRIQELIRVGEPAVPALIDCVEKDERLTRSMWFGRDFHRHRALISVKEAALTAVMSIIQVPVFEEEPYRTFSGQDSESKKAVVKKLRAYWTANAAIPLDERMMKVLRDPKSSEKALQAAVRSLAHPGQLDVLHTNGWADRAVIGDRRADNPAIDKFSNPTVAEAMLAAMDRHIAADKHYASQIEDFYAFNLAAFGDRRIIPAVRRRIENAKSDRQRWLWALICHNLGESRPLNAAAGEFSRRGRKSADLYYIVRSLVWGDTEQCCEALDALGNSKHACFEAAKSSLLSQSHPSMDESEFWFGHPYCVRILADELSHEDATGVSWRYEDRSLVQSRAGCDRGWHGCPEYLSLPSARVESVDERRCDVAAQILSTIVLGLPEYHAIAKDAGERLSVIRTTLSRNLARIRRMSEAEATALNYEPRRPFVPDMPPLGRAATEEDVHAGRAVFFLPPGAVVAEQRLPATAFLKEQWEVAQVRYKDWPAEELPKIVKRVLVVQAERGIDGKTYYGILGKGMARRFSEDELIDIRPIGDVPK